MNCESMSRATGTSPSIVRHLNVTVASARHGRGFKRMAHQFDLDNDNDAMDCRARTPRPCCKKPKRGIFKDTPPPNPNFCGESPLLPSETPRASLHASEASSSSSVVSFGSGSGAIATRRPAGGYDGFPNSLEGCATRGLKRRADPQSETEERGVNYHFTNSAKRPRTDAPSPQRGEEASTSSPISSKDNTTAPPSLSTTTQSSVPPQFELFAGPRNFVPLPPQTRKWESPKTSPLGPQTAQYRRRSHLYPTPSSTTCNEAKKYLVRNLFADNSKRNPYDQSPQWCEDMHILKLEKILQPTYTCPHDYHPSDPEYDEEWAHETWSDADWSDDEDALETPVDQEADTTVTIVVSEEIPRSNNNFSVEDWEGWHPPLVVPSQMSGIHPPLLFPWATPEQADVKARGQCGDYRTLPADMFSAS